MSLTRPKPAARDAPDADRRLRLLATLAAEQITCVGTGRFSSLSTRAADAPEQMVPEDCLRRALHIVAEHRSPSMALAWFVTASGKDEAPIDVLARGGCAEVLARAQAAR